MAKLEKGVFDSGPFIHLQEIEQLKTLEIVKEKYLSPEVKSELEHYRINLTKIKNLKIKALLSENKDLAKFICGQYDLDLGEATSISLAKQEKINLFFTDDLEARETAKRYDLEVHGTLGILMRALREKILTKEKTIELIKQLHQSSTLFLTEDLVAWTIREIQQFKI